MKDIVLNIVAAAIYALLGALAYRFALRPWKRRRSTFARATPFDPSLPTVVTYGMRTPRSANEYYALEEGDLAAICWATSKLTELCGSHAVTISACHALKPPDESVYNLLAIGGPRWNTVTARMLGSLGSPVTFAGVEALVVDTATGVHEYHADINHDGEVIGCYGAIVAGPVRPGTGTQHNVVVCGGLNNLGTLGAVVYLMSLIDGKPASVPLRKLSRRPWAIILRVDGSPSSEAPRGTRPPLDPHSLDVRVVRVVTHDAFCIPYRCDWNLEDGIGWSTPKGGDRAH